MAVAAVRHISTCTVRHSRSVGEEERQCHLNPWDLCYLSIHYIQKGLLFLKPPASPGGAVSPGGKQEGGEVVHGSREEGFSLDVVVAHLKRSLAATLDHFYPLSGRLATVQHPDDGGISVFIDCSNQGVEFAKAAADVTVSDLLSSPFVPHIVRSFFPLNDAVGYDGHSLPLLAVQVTELVDGYFVGCSMNHSVADGTSFWHFFNSWSAIARGEAVRLLPVVGRRWFPEKLREPLRLPSPNGPGNQLIRRPLINRELEDAVFHFPRLAVAALKARANAEAGGCGAAVVISSLQALLAFLWRVVTRARGLPPDHVAVYRVAVGLRQRLQPPPPLGYLGNLMRMTAVSATVDDLLGRPLGEVAEMLNRGIASETDAAARGWAESWAEDPNLTYVEGTKPGVLFTGSSPRFDVYGNDFRWGRPVAVWSGMGNKLDGKLTIFPGAEEGSMDMEMYLPPQVLLALMVDEEFMSTASLLGSMIIRPELPN